MQPDWLKHIRRVSDIAQWFNHLLGKCKVVNLISSLKNQDSWLYWILAKIWNCRYFYISHKCIINSNIKITHIIHFYSTYFCVHDYVSACVYPLEKILQFSWRSAHEYTAFIFIAIRTNDNDSLTMKQSSFKKMV